MTIIRELIEAIEESTNNSFGCLLSSDQLMLDRIPSAAPFCDDILGGARQKHPPVNCSSSSGERSQCRASRIPGSPGFSLTRCQFINANSIRAIANRISGNRISRSTNQRTRESVERESLLVKHGEASGRSTLILYAET